jgi:K+ transporter
MIGENLMKTVERFKVPIVVLVTLFVVFTFNVDHTTGGIYSALRNTAAMNQHFAEVCLSWFNTLSVTGAHLIIRIPENKKLLTLLK